MIFSDFLKALGQLTDPRFRRVLWLGLGLTLALLFGIYAVVLGAIGLLTPDNVSLPFIGQVTWFANLISGVSILLMLVLSIFLMVPVASAFTSLFLDDVANAVEQRHYRDLSPVVPLPWSEALGDTLRFLGLIIGANIVALLAYVLMPPAAPLIFWGMNGFLLGREYFQLVAIRRMSREDAKAMWRENSGAIWFAGALMAVPLSIPVVNLLVPIVGAATFTHLFHRLDRGENAGF
jgi:CysZ protein